MFFWVELNKSFMKIWNAFLTVTDYINRFWQYDGIVTSNRRGRVLLLTRRLRLFPRICTLYKIVFGIGPDYGIVKRQSNSSLFLLIGGLMLFL